jgi:hypothetical protein
MVEPPQKVYHIKMLFASLAVGQRHSAETLNDTMAFRGVIDRYWHFALLSKSIASSAIIPEFFGRYRFALEKEEKEVTSLQCYLCNRIF